MFSISISVLRCNNENPSKRPGASPQRKSKSHSIRATEMRSKIHTSSNQKGAISTYGWILLRIPVARILWDFDFLRGLAHTSSNQKGAISTYGWILLRIPVARILWDFDFLRDLAHTSSNQKGAISTYGWILLRIPVARILRDFDFL